MLGKDYLVVEEIGIGGMAVVYLVEHQTLLKQFAAKVLSVEMSANTEARARFTQEAHAASQLDHENIVNIFDFGVTADRRPYFVMELLRGSTLDQRVEAGPMSLEEIVAVAVPVSRALAYAHAEGVVHRDVKPENIFLVQRSMGRWGVKVVDFGIAKAPVNTRLTKMGQTLGSPMFMAPEACRGEDVDHRADIYSVGILLYLMTCGQVPFFDDNLLKVLQMQVNDPLVPPRKINPVLSPGIAAVIERALEKDPDARFQSMVELIDDLEAALPPGADRLLLEVQRGESLAVRNTPYPGIQAQRVSRPLPRVSEPPVTIPPPRRSRGMLIVLAVLSMVFAAGGIAFAVWRAQDKPAPATAQPAPLPTTTATATGSAQAPTPPRVVAPVVDNVRLEIKTTPDGAVAMLDGDRLGETPISIEVPRQSRTGVLVVSRAGYRDVEKKVDLATGGTFELALDEEREPRRPKPDKPAKPAKPAKPDKPDKPNRPKPDGEGSAKRDLDIRTTR